MPYMLSLDDVVSWVAGVELARRDTGRAYPPRVLVRVTKEKPVNVHEESYGNDVPDIQRQQKHIAGS